MMDKYNESLVRPTLNMGIEESTFDLRLDLLNNDCIFELFKWLSPDDLYALSKTCSRIGGLALNYYERKYSLNMMRIYWRPAASNIRNTPIEKYVARFSGHMKRISVLAPSLEMVNAESNARLLSYLTSDYIHKVKEMIFGYIRFREEDVEWMKQILRNFEETSIQASHPVDLIVSLLENCKRLKKLYFRSIIKSHKKAILYNEIVWQKATVPDMKMIIFENMEYITCIANRAIEN